jgi:hypothetical protein
MKGYYIEITNNLLDPKHRKRMQESVWLFMWLLDKMTSISEEGIGKVLGGKPIKYEEIKKDLGISRSTFNRWTDILIKEKYIITIRTPYGLSFSINKAKKTFGQKVDKSGISSGQSKERCVMSGQRCVIEDTSNIRQYKDNTINIYNNKNKKPFSNLTFRGLPVVKDKFTGKLKALDNNEWLEIDDRYLSEVKNNNFNFRSNRSFFFRISNY